MAAKPFPKEQLNFFKFSMLVLDEFPLVLRQIFITMWDSKVAIRPGFMVWDDSTKVRNMLLTSEGGKTDIPTTKSIEEWDCTALFKATIYAKSFGISSSKGSTLNYLYLKKVKLALGSFHSSVQSSTGNQDETYALAIDQLRLLRNTLCHSSKPEIIKKHFDNYVQLVNDVLTAVNVDTAFVDSIGQMSEDDFPTEKVEELRKCREKELQTISMFHENVVEKLSSIGERAEKFEAKVDQKLSSIHTMMKGISLGETENTLGALPKPHIPSSVPLFTGRKDEVGEITNLITDQSTRMLNIWGSPGFGKTSTAIEVSHKLGYPVYFFKLQGVSTVGEFLSKVLSIFKSNVVDHSLTPIDKLVSIFREISSPIILMFDNLDDLLSADEGGTSSTKLTRVFEELLDSNVSITILVTTRELLEHMRDRIIGFQSIRIRPLHPVSSIDFVRQLLPSFSETVITEVAVVSSHVPLTIKLVASLVKNNTEDTACKILEELRLSGNLLEQVDCPYEQNMQMIFEALFERLSLNGKHALVSLALFSSAAISKDAAIDVVSGKTGVAKAVGSLKTLVNKSIIDEYSSGEYYSIHPFIFSFVVGKAKEADFESVVKSSRIRFSRYYLLLFERLNDDFLAGKSIEGYQLPDTMSHLSIAIDQFIPSGFENFQDLLRILSKSEIFLYFIGLSLFNSLDIPKLYEFVIDKCKTLQQCNNYVFKLYISKYFYGIVPSILVSLEHSDIPEDIRKDAMLLLDGSAAKLGCYEGILLISKGRIKSGIKLIETHVDGLQRCADQQLVKCLCFQVLALLYSDLKECDKSRNASRKTVEVCEEIGNYNLFLIDKCKETSSEEYKGEQLILFVYLLSAWSSKSLSDETKLFFFNFVNSLQQDLEKKQFCTLYLYQIVMLGDFLLTCLGSTVGRSAHLEEKINSLNQCLKCDDNCFLAERAFPVMSKTPTIKCFLPYRLLQCYILKIFSDQRRKGQNLNVATCRDALDLSIERFGRQHRQTAFFYLKMGLAENVAENYSSAFDAFDQALEILCSNGVENLAEVYIEKGWTCIFISEFESAAACFEEALNARERLFKEDTDQISQILWMLGVSQLTFDLYSGIETLKRALQMNIELCAENPNAMGYVCLCHFAIGKAHHELGNYAESIESFEAALKVCMDFDVLGSELRAQIFAIVFVELIELQEYEYLYMQRFNRVLPVLKENCKELLPCLYLILGFNQLQSGKYEAGLTSLQEALGIELNVTLSAHVTIRDLTVSSYIDMVNTLVKIGKAKLARKAINKAITIAETLPEGIKYNSIFQCYTCKGSLQNRLPDYASAIKSFEHALVQLPKIPDAMARYVRREILQCRWEVAIAYFHERSYKDALTSIYHVLSIVKDVFAEGSEIEAELYLLVASTAREMQNRNLEISNLRLACKIYSKILGITHSKTEECYITYVRALFN